MAKEKETGGGFAALRLKRATLKELSDMRRAFEFAYRKEFTNDEFIRQLLASVEGGDPAVWENFCKIRELSEELEKKAQERLGNRV